MVTSRHGFRGFRDEGLGLMAGCGFRFRGFRVRKAWV